jgi:hypothetical protein
VLKSHSSYVVFGDIIPNRSVVGIVNDGGVHVGVVGEVATFPTAIFVPHSVRQGLASAKEQKNGTALEVSLSHCA